MICNNKFNAIDSSKTCSKDCQKERIKKYNKEYTKNHPYEYVEYTKKYRKNNKDKTNKNARKRYKRDGEKLRIRVNSRHYAKKIGVDLQNGTCNDCNKNKKLEIHHITYTIDDFILLCEKCHMIRHNKILRVDRNE